MGGSSSNGGSTRSAVEAPNTLISNTRIKIVDMIGEGWQGGFWPQSGISGSNPLCSVYLDNTPILNGDGSPNWNISGQGFRFAYRSGTSGQLPMEGFEKVEALIPLPTNTRVTNPPLNNGYPKSVAVAFNTSMYPDAEGIKVTTRIPALYTVNTQNGDTNQYNISWTVECQLNNGAWVTLDTQNVVGKCTSPYLRTLVYPLPKTDPASTFYEWKVRVRRISEQVLSNSTANELFVDSIAVVSSNTYRYPMTALVGLELSADQFGTIPTRAYDVKGTQVLVPEGYEPTQYNVDGTITAATYPGIWLGVWGSERKWTDNPAFIFYDLCTNKRYGLGNYIRAEWLDKWTIYQIAQYCDEMVDDGNGGLEPRFTCNVALQTPQDAYTLLNNLVSVFQGMLYWANGRVFPVGSETRDPVYNFSNANVVGGAFIYSDTPRNTRSTVCTVRWVDPDNLFRSTPERIEDPAARAKYGIIEKQITAFACTSRGQAIRAANWLLTTEQQLTDTVQFQTTIGGLYLRPGMIVNIYDNIRNNQQQGGAILDFNSARDTITLDKEVTLDPAFTYYMAALVPSTNISNASGITGSNQFGLINNSQMEVRRVTTIPGTWNVLTTNSGFGAALFRGSIFTLSASGDNVTIFDKATQYRVLTTTQPEPNKIGVLAVEYQTGINYLVNNNYSSVTNPPIEGNTTPPTAPTGARGTRVTGLLNDNTFFSYAYVDWTGTDPTNTAWYDVSGRLGGGLWFSIGQPTTTGVQFVPESAGTYSLRVAAFNANGYGSAYNSGVYVEPFTNPFVTTAPLSGVIISNNYDPYTYSVALNRYTGYVGTTPTFLWDAALDGVDDSLEVPSAQYITGYRIKFKRIDDGTTDLLPEPIIVEGKDINQLTLDGQFLYTGASIKPLRAFIFDVETMDEFGQVASGARLAVNNIQPPPPVASGFVGFNGGVSYNITPARTADVSGVYLWTNPLPSFIPTYDNVTLVTSNLAGFVSGPQQGNVYTWFSLIDSFGYSGSRVTNGDYNAPIYGPISGNANQVVGDLFVNIDNQISGAFSYLTGTFTDYFRILSGQNETTYLSVQGISGQITGLGSIPGAVNTALTVRVDTAVLSASGATATQIDAVSARLALTGSDNYAQTATVATALATTGGALSSFITALQAYTSGANARVTIAAQAFVTGDVNGFGGQAVARYGFKLDANGKVVSMEATSSSFPGTYGTIVFGQANLQSDTFTAGSAGWRITADGNAEFNTASVRGAFTGGSAGAQTIMDNVGMRVGDTAADYVRIGAGSNKGIVQCYAADNGLAAQLGYQNIAGTNYGILSLNNDAGSATVTLIGGGTCLFSNAIDLQGGARFGAGSSPSTVATVYNGSNSTSLAGGSPSEDFTIDLTNRGFSAAPVAGFLNCIDPLYVVAYNSATSTSTTANCSIRSTDGSNIPNTTTPIGFLFIS